MAILVYCNSCKRYFSRKNDYCPVCSSSLLKSRKFWVNIKTPDGGRTTHVVEGTLTFAKNVEAKIKGEIAQKKHFNIGRAKRIDYVWDKYIAWAEKNKKAWIDDKRRWEKHVEPFVKDRKMDSISRATVRRILSKMEDNGLSPATVKHVYALIRRVYNWSIENDLYYGSVPTAKIKPPKVNNAVTECLTDNEYNSLIKILDEWDNQLGALLVKFALYTGFRQGECMKLTWDNVDLINGYVRFIDPKGKPATIPISISALDILNEAKKLTPIEGCEFVFPNSEGQGRVSFKKIWERIRKKSGIRKSFRFHDLRHTFASYMASSGEVDIYTLQKLLNHQDPKMTQRYAHLLDEALRRGANVADKVFKNSK